MIIDFQMNEVSLQNLGHVDNCSDNLIMAWCSDKSTVMWNMVFSFHPDIMRGKRNSEVLLLYSHLPEALCGYFEHLKTKALLLFFADHMSSTKEGNAFTLVCYSVHRRKRADLDTYWWWSNWPADHEPPTCHPHPNHEPHDLTLLDHEPPDLIPRLWTTCDPRPWATWQTISHLTHSSLARIGPEWSANLKWSVRENEEYAQEPWSVCFLMLMRGLSCFNNEM